MNINFVFTRPVAKKPYKATDGSVGFDLYAIDYNSYYDHLGYLHIRYYTGVAVELPRGFFGMVAARSSVSQTDLYLAYGQGIIDNDYRGEISLEFICRWGNYHLPSDAPHVQPLAVIQEHANVYDIGDRIGQLIILPYVDNGTFVEVDSLTPTQRGTGGYGSTGK